MITSSASPYVAAHVRRIRARPLGSRQASLLACIRARLSAGEPFPSLDVLAADIGCPRATSDVYGSLLALEVRGLIRSTASEPPLRGTRRTRRTDWEITEAGWLA